MNAQSQLTPETKTDAGMDLSRSNALAPTTESDVEAQDKYGFNSAAQKVAKSIVALKNPYGHVVGIEGAWGSGKTSYLNLIKINMKLTPSEAANRFQFHHFEHLWQKTEDHLADSFLEFLRNIVTSQSWKRVRQFFYFYGARLFIGIGIAGGAYLYCISKDLDTFLKNLAIPAAVFAIVPIYEKLSSSCRNVFFTHGSIEDKHEYLKKEFSVKQEITVIVIDDLDRMPPQEVISTFKLIKSFGKLPNLLFIVLFDQKHVTDIITSELNLHNSEEPSKYIEKFVDVVIKTPTISSHEFRNKAEDLCKDLCKDFSQEWTDEIYDRHTQDIASIYIKHPRDIVRLENSTAFTWSTAEGRINFLKFLSLEMIRLFDRSLFHVIETDLMQAFTTVDPEDSSHKDVIKAQKEPHERILTKLFVSGYPESNTVDSIELETYLLQQLSPNDILNADKSLLQG